MRIFNGGAMQKYKPFALALAALIVAVVAVNLLMSGYDRYTAYEQKQKAQPKELVYNSSYDGSVRQVEDWLKSNLNDTDSLSFVEWSKVAKTPKGNFVVRCKYRAKNTYGAMVLENKVFFLNKDGQYIYQTDYQK
jgi:hypothetical protein